MPAILDVTLASSKVKGDELPCYRPHSLCINILLVTKARYNNNNNNLIVLKVPLNPNQSINLLWLPLATRNAHYKSEQNGANIYHSKLRDGLQVDRPRIWRRTLFRTMLHRQDWRPDRRSRPSLSKGSSTIVPRLCPHQLEDRNHEASDHLPTNDTNGLTRPTQPSIPLGPEMSSSPCNYMDYEGGDH